MTAASVVPADSNRVEHARPRLLRYSIMTPLILTFLSLLTGTLIASRRRFKPCNYETISTHVES